MGNRLTDDELDEALAVAQSLNSLRLTAAMAELKERRAQDLNEQEVADLRELLETFGGTHYPDWQKRALAALSKLLTRGNR